ncbi:MAG TPA: GC-type dockerin domain-anchored protein [Phycisphaerales bacterium]|nr:GC-type dockerin domain-anchored protein [Phycisphaerales bacterium]
MNKALRQAAFVAAMIGQFTADYGGDALDNGDLPTFEAHFKAALAAWIASGSSPIDLSSYVLRAGDTMTGLFASPAGFKTASRALTTATTLTTADFGKFISLSSGSTFTTTFPTPVSNGSGAFTVFNNSVVAQTVSTPAGAFLGPGASSATTESIPAGSVYRYVSDGSNWIRSVATNAPNALPKLSFIQTTQTWTRAAGATKAFVIAHGPGGAGGGEPAGAPTTAGGSGGGGGGWAFAIGWGVDETRGLPVSPPLDRIDFVRITTGVHGTTSLLGEVSTEVSAVADVRARYTADWDRNGLLEVADIFAFLNSWFAGIGENGGADFNESGAVTVQDIFDFLNAWFAG